MFYNIIGLSENCHPRPDRGSKSIEKILIWIPAFAGMTNFNVISTILGQSDSEYITYDRL